MGGLTFKPVEKFSLKLDAVWNASDGGLEPFVMVVPEEFLAVNLNSSYDFSETNTYSDLDVSRFEMGVGFSWGLNERLFIAGGYRYLEFEDDAPYLYDLDGSVNFYSLGLGWVF